MTGNHQKADVAHLRASLSQRRLRTLEVQGQKAQEAHRSESVFYNAMVERLDKALEAKAQARPEAQWLIKVLAPIIKVWKRKYLAAYGDVDDGEGSLIEAVDTLATRLQP